MFTCCWTLQFFNGWSDWAGRVRRASAFYSWMLLTATAFALSSPPRHRQVFNGRFVIFHNFWSQIGHIWNVYFELCLPTGQFVIAFLWIPVKSMADLLHSLVNMSSECCFSPAFMHDEAVGFSLNKSPGHMKQSGLKEVLFHFAFSLCFMSDYNHWTQRGHRSLCGTSATSLQ